MTSFSRIYSDMIDDMVRDLTGRSDVRRTSAVERCSGLPEDLLLEITSRLLIRYHKQVLMQWCVYLMGAIGMVSVATLLQGNVLFAYGVVGLVIARHLQLTYRHTGRSLQGLLQNSEDKRLIPILLLKYSTPDGAAVWPQHARVRDLGLTQLLPYVAQSDNDLWTNQMRARLTALLKTPCTSNPMTFGVLHALSEVGDDAAIAKLIPLTESEREQHGLSLRSRTRIPSAELRAAAASCVDAIRVRVNRRMQQTVLLRACATEIPLNHSLPRSIECDEYLAALELIRPIEHGKPLPAQELEEQCQG